MVGPGTVTIKPTPRLRAHYGTSRRHHLGGEGQGADALGRSAIVAEANPGDFISSPPGGGPIVPHRRSMPPRDEVWNALLG